MSIHIYNTLTGRKQEFIPITPGKVKMYVCGVTVYDYCHLGHGRAYVAFDTIYRYLRYVGYDVTYIRNVTDIDDKIINRANKMGVDTHTLAQRFLDEFHRDAESLNLLPPTHEPKATEYIPQMIKIIEKLIEKGMAYVIDGDVYFDVSKFPGYGMLSGRSPDELMVGARVEPDPRKRTPLDFSLWKSAKPNEPSWASPWGKGRPGWHIECSSMSLNLLGDEFDIHGGGQDLIFPHHENEIAQSFGYTGKMPVRYWIHNGFVTLNKEKMSKSLGNFFTLRDIFKKYDPNVVRFFLLSQHYRSPIDFSDQLLEDAKGAIRRIEECLRRAEVFKQVPVDISIAEDLRKQFRLVMDDDFNTAQALALIFDIVKEINKSGSYTHIIILREFLDILGIRYKLPKTIRIADELEITESELESMFSGDLDYEKLIKLVRARHYLRRTKKWVLADRIRWYLGQKGYTLQDTANWTEVISDGQGSA